MINAKFRNYTDEDKNFILSSWLKGLRQKRSSEMLSKHSGREAIIEQGYFAAFMPHDLCYERFRPIIESRVLPKSEAIIAYNPDHEDQIYGYIVFRKLKNASVISFCYVKQPFRKFGIGKALFDLAKSQTNVSTYYATWLAKLFKKEGIVFDPFFDLDI